MTDRAAAPDGLVRSLSEHQTLFGQTDKGENQQRTKLSSLQDRLHGLPGLCSYRVRGVDGCCSKHLPVESYTVVMLLTFILIIISIPSPSLLYSRLKTLLLCKSFPR